MTITLNKITLHTSEETVIDPATGSMDIQETTSGSTLATFDFGDGDVVQIDVAHYPLTIANIRTGLANTAFNLQRGLSLEECQAVAGEVDVTLAAVDEVPVDEPEEEIGE